MRVFMRTSWLSSHWAVVLGAACAVLVLAPLGAQTPTPEQLQLFQQLPADQQQALLQRATGAGAAVTPQVGPTRRVDEDAVRRSAQQVQQAQVAASAEAQRLLELQAEDTVLVAAELQTRETLTEQERTKLTALRDLIRARNPYVLSRSGQLLLPGFEPISVAGLSEAQATQRIAAEPALLKLELKLTRLPVARSGTAALKPFGYDLFEQAAAGFAAQADAPVPPDYVVGPGDELGVQLYGSRTSRCASPWRARARSASQSWAPLRWRGCASRQPRLPSKAAWPSR